MNKSPYRYYSAGSAIYRYYPKAILQRQFLAIFFSYLLIGLVISYIILIEKDTHTRCLYITILAVIVLWEVLKMRQEYLKWYMYHY
jgi:hypothetical protein